MKLYTIIWYYSIIAIFFFLSCAAHKKETDSEVLILKKVKPNELPISPTPSIVKLETTDSCLIGNIIQIEKDDSLIFILDTYKKLYVFDRKGYFLNTIGMLGDSPEAYISCPFFYIDKKKKLLTVVDQQRSRILNYSYDGKLVSLTEIQSPEDMKWCSKGVLGDDGNVLVYRSMNPFDNYQYALFDTENYLCKWKKHSYDPIRPADHMVDFSNHPMVNVEENVHFILPLCDTIFQYNQGEIQPAYVVELPQPMLPKKLFREELDTHKSYFSVANELAGDTYFSGFTNIFETTTHLLLTYKNRYVGWYYLADKNGGRGFFKPFSMSSDLSDIPFMEVVSSTEDEFIGLIDCETLLNLEEKLENKSSIHPDLKEIIAISEFDDNPCLVFYRF